MNKMMELTEQLKRSYRLIHKFLPLNNAKFLENPIKIKLRQKIQDQLNKPKIIQNKYRILNE